MSAAAYDALVLNADYRPLSVKPLLLWNWCDAVHAAISGRVHVVETYDRVIRSPSFEMKLPSVIALKSYQTRTRWAPFTRYSIFLRDDYRCAYCGQRFRSEDLTFEHVTPRARGGKTTWENVVTACGPCNLRKRDRTPREAGMPLLFPPYRPTLADLDEIGRKYPPNHLHETWRDYLYWDSALQE